MKRPTDVCTKSKMFWQPSQFTCKIVGFTAPHMELMVTWVICIMYICGKNTYREKLGLAYITQPPLKIRRDWGGEDFTQIQISV